MQVPACRRHCFMLASCWACFLALLPTSRQCRVLLAISHAVSAQHRGVSASPPSKRNF